MLPADGQLSTCFCMRWGTFHYGIDLAAPLGTPIYAATDGVVLRAGPATGFGNAIYIEDTDGNVEVYGHMRYYSVKTGQVVHAGDQIAKVGNEGESTGPHLHFQIDHGSEYGKPIDPCRGSAVPRRSRRPRGHRGQDRPDALGSPSGARPALELHERGVAQEQPLGAAGAEVDRGLGLVAHAVDLDDRAEPERVVADPVARLEREDRAVPDAAARPPRGSPVGRPALATVASTPGPARCRAPVDGVGRHLVEEPRRRVVLRAAPSCVRTVARER